MTIGLKVIAMFVFVVFLAARNDPTRFAGWVRIIIMGGLTLIIVAAK